MEAVNKNIGAIDIGSNGARLLIKNVYEDQMGNYGFTKVLFLRIPLRLGKDVFTLGRISEERETMMLRMIKSYKQLMKLYSVSRYRACATSAMRDAANGPDILKRIKRKTDIDIEIIGGREEAFLLYNCSIEGDPSCSGNYAYMDVGGGSTEISMINDGKLVGSFSYNIGTIRILSGAADPDVLERLRRDMMAYSKQYKDITLIGSGGNINKLCRLYYEGVGKGRGKVLPVKALRDIHDSLKPLSFKERMDRYGLKADRADVIIPASEIFLEAADSLGCQDIRVPNISLADGIIDWIYKQEKCKA